MANQLNGLNFQQWIPWQHAITFWWDLGNLLMGLSPFLWHWQTLFRKRSKAVSSVNIVCSQLSFICICAHVFLISMCHSVSISIPQEIVCVTFVLHLFLCLCSTVPISLSFLRLCSTMCLISYEFLLLNKSHWAGNV